MTTAIVTDECFAAHTQPTHVERAERLQAVIAALDASGLRPDLHELTPRRAEANELTAVHTPDLLAAIERLSNQGGGHFDADTYITAGSWEAAQIAAGSAVRTVEAVLGGECHNAFALLRPPGHHATPSQAMGFCLVNNIAVAARHAVQQLGLSRVAIVDYDVHHGNGTQDVFYGDPQVLVCSTHAAPFYPGTGSMRETGVADATGTTLNIPLPFGVGDRGYEQVFSDVVIPALHHWQPQLILVSAGYDAHWNDPLGPMLVSVTGFARLTAMLNAAADELCNGRIALFLEGGYNLDVLGASVVAALRVLLGRDPGEDPLGIVDAREPDISHVVARVRHQHPLLDNGRHL